VTISEPAPNAAPSEVDDRTPGIEQKASLRLRLAGLWEYATVAFLASVMFVVGFGGGIRRMSVPWGAGDLLGPYSVAKLWSEGGPFGNSRFGFPFGMELRYFPATDHLQNAIAGLIAAVTGNPFLGINAVYALSFPLTALAALWVLKIARLRGPIAITIALAFTAIPYHWLRTDHIYLATIYSAALGVGLALLVGTGELERRLRGERRLWTGLAMLGIAAVIATSGIYYACFTILICSAALVYRFARGARWRGLLISMSPVVAVVACTGLALAPAVLYDRAHPALQPVAERIVIESVQYSGVLAFTLLPAPVSDIPGFGPVNESVTRAVAAVSGYPTSGVLWYADFGSLETIAALALLVVGVVFAARRSAFTGRRRPSPQEPVNGSSESVGFGLVGTLLSTTVLFFIPWGLNLLFAYFVTPQLRAWDRLVPVLFLLVFTGAAVAWRTLNLPRHGGKAVVIAVVILVVLVFDSVIPYRSRFTTISTTSSAFSAAGYTYATDLNAAVPGRCGVLELPYLGYPEVPPIVGLGSSEPLWPALTNPEKSWSFGAMKGTLASAWQVALGNKIDANAVRELEAGGFCAIHVDRRGFSPADADKIVADLTALLGPVVATGLGGNWLAFALPSGHADHGITVADLATVPQDTAVFYAPPAVTPKVGLAVTPEHDVMSEWWWLPVAPAAFDVKSIDQDVEFSSVSGELLAVECAAQEATVELESGAQTVSTVVQLGPGERKPFTLQLDTRTASAVLRVSAHGVSCATPQDPRVRTVALVDPTVSS
jgi:hypothetical protein